MKNKIFKWVIRSFYLVIMIGMALFVNWIIPGLIPLMIGFGFFFMYIGFHLSFSETKFDRIVKCGSLFLALFFIVGSMIKIDSKVVTFDNIKDYSVSIGTDGANNKTSLYVTVDDSTKILDFKNVMNFSPGSWFIYMGEPVEKSGFSITVEQNKYIIGTRSYVNFNYNDKIIENINDKKFR